MSRQRIIVASALLLTCAGAFIFNVTRVITVKPVEFSTGSIELLIQATSSVADTSAVAHSRFVFVGDIMLARHVEYLMSLHGYDYPFKGYSLKANYPAATIVGNFEGAVPSIHQKTPNFGFSFSIAPQYLAGLTEAGFTHLGLANNHAFDFGKAGYSNATTTLTANGLVTFGDPTAIIQNTVTYVTGEDGRVVALVGLYTVVSNYDDEALKELFAAVNTHSDLQIVFIHWGIEYERIASPTQKALAEKLAGLGVDVIIGHHPHVVQPIEQIGSTTVFYSLGNYIFDQYFSTFVEEGLVLSLDITASELSIKLLPVTSEVSHAQPRLMSTTQQENFLQDLADRSDPRLHQEIRSGVLTIPLALATSTKIAIMDK